MIFETKTSYPQSQSKPRQHKCKKSKSAYTHSKDKDTPHYVRIQPLYSIPLVVFHVKTSELSTVKYPHHNNSSLVVHTTNLMLPHASNVYISLLFIFHQIKNFPSLLLKTTQHCHQQSLQQLPVHLVQPVDEQVRSKDVPWLLVL
jgi:hypothetical protein